VTGAPGAHLPTRVWAVMPSYDDVPERSLIEELLGQVVGLTVVDDGSNPRVADELQRIADDSGAELVRHRERRGKGAALRTGVRAALERTPRPDTLVLIDADGQHPPAAIPAFVAASSTAELVIGDRFADLAAMPWQRRIANLVSRRVLELATHRPVRDTQSGMRLLRGRALDLPLAGDGYEAESRQLKAALVAGLDVAWVPIPAIYGGERSSFRPIRDSVRVLAALVRPVERPRPRPVQWPRLTGRRRRCPTSSALRDRPAIGRRSPQEQATAP
jgi:glycosyltransferase involved in cell wall biosynthesis